MNEKKYLTVSEIAKMCRVQIKFVRKEISNGNMPAVKVGKAFLVEEKDVLAYLEARKVVIRNASIIG